MCKIFSVARPGRLRCRSFRNHYFHCFFQVSSFQLSERATGSHARWSLLLSRNAGKDCDRLTLTKSRGCIDGIGCQVSGRRRFRHKKCTHPAARPREHGWRSRCCSRSRHTCSPQFLVSPPRPDSASFPPSNKPNTRSPTPLRLPPRSRPLSLSQSGSRIGRKERELIGISVLSVCHAVHPQ